MILLIESHFYKSVDSLIVTSVYCMRPLEMATPGWGPRHPPGPPPRDGGWGRGIDYPKPRGTGDFFENPPGVFGGFYVIKTAVFIEIWL